MVAIGNAVKHVPTAQAALALATTGTGLAWSLFLPGGGEMIRSFCAFVGACLLAPVILKVPAQSDNAFSRIFVILSMVV